MVGANVFRSSGSGKAVQRCSGDDEAERSKAEACLNLKSGYDTSRAAMSEQRIPRPSAACHRIVVHPSDSISSFIAP